MIDRRQFLFSTTILAAVGTATFGWAADAKDAEVLVTIMVLQKKLGLILFLNPQQ